jgi:hypothetical protein
MNEMGVFCFCLLCGCVNKETLKRNGGDISALKQEVPLPFHGPLLFITA